MPPTHHTHPLNPMSNFTQVQDDQAFEALTNEELEATNGGISMIPIVVPIIVDLRSRCAVTSIQVA